MSSKILFILLIIISNSSIAFANTNKKSGLPQFDYTSYPKQVFWFLVIFIIFYMLLIKIIIPKIKYSKNQRKAYLDQITFNNNKYNEEIKKLDNTIKQKYNISNLNEKTYFNTLYKNLLETEKYKIQKIINKHNKIKEITKTKIFNYNNHYNIQRDLYLEEIITILLEKSGIQIDNFTIKQYIFNTLNTRENKNV